ncbi:MAG: DUF5916 domain-containing protein [Vicinamibacteria bacterium]
MKSSTQSIVFALLLAVIKPHAALAQEKLAGETLQISRATGSIKIDGDLSDEGWKAAKPVTTWYEVNPGDNTEPAIKNVGRIAYDDHFFYASFEFADPNPKAIRAPYSDRDDSGGGFYDFGGIVLDAGNSGRTGKLFVVTPRNIQNDTIIDDASGEDPSPDFFWESATKITEHGWVLEMRIPFSSLRYKNSDPQTWAVLMYRNYPRERNYQFFSARLPRGFNCFVCHANTLEGLQHLPQGSHLVAAPYLSSSTSGRPTGGLGSSLANDPTKQHVGLDLKYTPNSDTALDLTVKPDFSQVESDAAQISANERFALFVPEKRSFFLEGTDLFQTPIQAVYTRTVTTPSFGGRITGKQAGIRYTALVVKDDGGGSVILPGPTGSSFAAQDFASTVLVARAKREIGRSFLSMLVTDREGRETSSHNRVVGPDFQFRPTATDAITGQWLMSNTKTPNRPDLAQEWTGQEMTSHAGQLQWGHSSRRVDATAVLKDIGDGFRAEAGFVPQVGYRETAGGAGWTFRPTGFVSKLRAFMDADRQADRAGDLISRSVQSGLVMNTRWNGFVQLRYMDDNIRSGNRLIGRRQLGYFAQFSPSRVLSTVSVTGTTGQEIDFANSRPGTGTTMKLSAILNPTNHLNLIMNVDQRWLNVDDTTGVKSRLFTARVARLRATYTLTSRLFVRLTGQYESTRRDPSLYTSSTEAKQGAFSGQALLSYKLNWQSVMFVGYGDDRVLSAQDRLEKVSRQFFVKLAYAVQR